MLSAGQRESHSHVLNTKVDDTGAESPGDSFILKSKRLEVGLLFPGCNFLGDIISKLWPAEAVVSSFIEYNLHPQLILF